MGQEQFNLEAYLSKGVERIVSTILRSTYKNPKESLFLMQYATAAKRAAKFRKQSEQEGRHIPPFLIASITNRCNLYCKGCYARANHSCEDLKEQGPGNLLMKEEDWRRVFSEAEKLGIGFILLAGGEPLLRKDIITAAGDYASILFPIFTNGTLLQEDYLPVLEKKRNLIPIISMEGRKGTTDARRGEGIYQSVLETMERLHQKDLLFGVSVTVTKENRKEVLAAPFIEELKQAGCKGIIYVDYVPVDHHSKELALSEEERTDMAGQIQLLRERDPEMLFVSFPGDEKTSGGCLAAGRGFFHINAYGGAEPCPFSPYSDTSIKKVSLLEALNSPLFVRLEKEGALSKEHIGGCVLFEQEETVKALAGDKE